MIFLIYSDYECEFIGAVQYQEEIEDFVDEYCCRKGYKEDYEKEYYYTIAYKGNYDWFYPVSGVYDKDNPCNEE